MSRRKIADALPIRLCANPMGRGDDWRYLNEREIIRVGDYLRQSAGNFINIVVRCPTFIGARVGVGWNEKEMVLRPITQTEAKRLGKAAKTRPSVDRVLAEAVALFGPGKGNFANPEQHSEAGKLGGAKVSKDRKHMAKIGRKGGLTIAQNKAHMSEIGRRGGKAGKSEVTK